jgi:zinc transport system permease protein
MIFTRVYKRIVVASVITGFIGTSLGYAISYKAGIPAGASIIFTLVVMWIIAKSINRLTVSMRTGG